MTPDSELIDEMTKVFAKRRKVESLFPASMFRPLSHLSFGSLYMSTLNGQQCSAIPRLLEQTPYLTRYVVPAPRCGQSADVLVSSFTIVQYINNAPALSNEWLLSLLEALPTTLEDLTLTIDREAVPMNQKAVPVYSGVLQVNTFLSPVALLLIALADSASRDYGLLIYHKIWYRKLSSPMCLHCTILRSYTWKKSHSGLIIVGVMSCYPTYL